MKLFLVLGYGLVDCKDQKITLETLSWLWSRRLDFCHSDSQFRLKQAETFGLLFFFFSAMSPKVPHRARAQPVCHRPVTARPARSLGLARSILSRQTTRRSLRAVPSGSRQLCPRNGAKALLSVHASARDSPPSRLPIPAPAAGVVSKGWREEIRCARPGRLRLRRRSRRHVVDKDRSPEPQREEYHRRVLIVGAR